MNRYYFKAELEFDDQLTVHNQIICSDCSRTNSFEEAEKMGWRSNYE